MNKFIYAISIFALILASCAKTGTISGGPKDEQAPVLIKSNPELKSVNIEPEKIVLTFDEFINISSLNKSLIVSPPLEQKPLTSLRGKSLIIEITDTLAPETTYSINFGNGIKDNNEGNELKNFVYVFSTGSFIDSMAVTGQVLDAYTLEPLSKEIISVFLYDNLSDSAVLKERALYVANCDENGFFAIQNVKEDVFNIFAVADANASYYYNGSPEKIAFIDSSFQLTSESFRDISIDPELTQPLQQDSSMLATDSTGLDSIFGKDLSYALHLKMYIFEEDTYKQRLVKKERESRTKINYIFNEKQEHFSFQLLEETSKNNDWYILEESENLDTLAIWITDSTIYRNDSIFFVSSYQLGDLDSTYMVSDTALFRFFEPKSRSRNRNNLSKQEPEEPSIQYTTYPKSNGKIDLHKKMKFYFETPLMTFDTSKISLHKKIDTLWVEQGFSMNIPDGNSRILHVDFEKEENQAYKLELLPNAFTDYYSASINDTTVLNFRTQAEDHYGILNFTLSNVPQNSIIQMFNTKNNSILREITVSEDYTWILDFLPPEEFSFRLIIDSNQNGKWDTGKYINKLQPEKVIYFDKKISIRSNWEIEESWNINL
jgi:hypothetical protein